MNKHHLFLQKLVSIIVIFLILQLSFLPILVDINGDYPEVDKTDNISEIAQYDNNIGPPRSLAGENNVVAFSTYDNLHLMDISQKNNPVIKANLSIYNIDNLFLKNNKLYLTKYDEFYIYELNNFTISHLSNRTLDNICNEMVIANTWACISTYEGNLTFLDFTNLENIEVTATIDCGESLKDICVNDDYLYILNESNRITIINTTDLTQPTAIQSYENYTGTITEMEIHDDNLFLLNATNEKLEIFNCSSGIEITPIATCNNCTGSEISFAESLSFIINSKELQIINITNIQLPEKIVEEELFDLVGFVISCYVYNSMLIVLDIFSDIYLVDIENIEQPSIMVTLDFTSYATDLVLYEEFIISCNFVGIDILTFKNNELRKVGYYEDPQGIQRMINIQKNKDVFYVTTNLQQLLTFRLKEDYKLELVNTYTDDQSIMGEMLIKDNFMFVLTASRVLIFDITDKEKPQYIDDIFTGAAFRGFALEGNYLVVLYSKTDSDRGIMIYDVKDPESPKEITRYKFNLNYSFNALDISDRYIFVGNGYNETIIFDYKDLPFVTKVCEFTRENKEIIEVVVKNQYLLFGFVDGISIYNIENIKEPTKVAHYFDGGVSRKIIIKENELFIADGYDGVEILQTEFYIEKSLGNQVRNLVLFVIVFTITMILIIIFVVQSRRKL